MSLNVLYILIHSCHVHGMNEMSTNSFYDLSVNGVYIQSINIFPQDVHSLHDLSANGFYDLSTNVMYVP